MSGALAALGIEGFERPLLLWLLLPAAAALVLAAARARPAAVAWPALGEARAAGARPRDPVRGAALALRAAALATLVVALAGPFGVRRLPPAPGHGLDVVLVLDASGSMRALDAEVEGDWKTRLELARSVVARFAAHRVSEGDRVALIVFGETAFTQSPLTSDGALLEAALARIEPGVAGEATALGDALGLAVKRALGGARARGAGAPEEGRVVVLLTDGRNNAGALSLEAATALARGEGVRVHTVGIGTAGSEVAMAPRDDAAARGVRFERHDVDASALADIARQTGGRFFPARRSSQLEEVYGEIDALERVTRPLPARVRHTTRAELPLALAASALLGEIALARLVVRRLP